MIPRLAAVRSVGSSVPRRRGVVGGLSFGRVTPVADVQAVASVPAEFAQQEPLMDATGAVHPVVDTSNATGLTLPSLLGVGNTGSGTLTLSSRGPSASGISAPINRACTWLGVGGSD